MALVSCSDGPAGRWPLEDITELATVAIAKLVPSCPDNQTLVASYHIVSSIYYGVSL